jgi:hypothetical protein
MTGTARAKRRGVGGGRFEIITILPTENSLPDKGFSTPTYFISKRQFYANGHEICIHFSGWKTAMTATKKCRAVSLFRGNIL